MLAGAIAEKIDRRCRKLREKATRAAHLSKADLTTGVVGNFPNYKA